jgi:hypothetical protein
LRAVIQSDSHTTGRKITTNGVPIAMYSRKPMSWCSLSATKPAKIALVPVPIFVPMPPTLEP